MEIVLIDIGNTTGETSGQARDKSFLQAKRALIRLKLNAKKLKSKKADNPTLLLTKPIKFSTKVQKGGQS